MPVVDMYNIKPFTTYNIPPPNKYPFQTTETMEQCVNMFKVTNKDTKVTSSQIIWCLFESF